jgi:hypothetical protein
MRAVCLPACQRPEGVEARGGVMAKQRQPHVQVTWESTDGEGELYAVHVVPLKNSVMTFTGRFYGQLLYTPATYGQFIIDDGGRWERRIIGSFECDFIGSWLIVSALSEEESMELPIVRECVEQHLRRLRRSVSQSRRYAILERDGFRCRYCGSTAADGKTLHVDHIVPVSCGGSDDASNLCAACSDCNLGKGNRFQSAPPGATA